jgi:uncharacterized protein YpmB
MVIIYHGIIKRKIEGDFLKVLKVIIPIVLILSLSSCMINSEEDVENSREQEKNLIKEMHQYEKTTNKVLQLMK